MRRVPQPSPVWPSQFGNWLRAESYHSIFASAKGSIKGSSKGGVNKKSAPSATSPSSSKDLESSNSSSNRSQTWGGPYLLESHNAVIPKGLLLIAETSMKTYFFWGLKVSHCAVRFQQLRTT